MQRLKRVIPPVSVDFTPFYAGGPLADHQFEAMMAATRVVSSGIKRRATFLFTFPHMDEPVLKKIDDVDSFVAFLLDCHVVVVQRGSLTGDALINACAVFTVFYNIELDYPYTLSDLKEMYNGPCEPVVVQ